MKSIQNYEILSQESIQSLVKPQSSYSRKLRRAFGAISPPREGPLTQNLIERINRGNDAYLNFRQLNKAVRDAEMRKQALLERVWMGAFGGVALIAPMLVMSLHRDLKTSLITSSVATALFVLILAGQGQSLKGQEVLGATAAYAAVLVVFVGTSMTPVSG